MSVRLILFDAYWDIRRCQLAQISYGRPIIC